MKFGKLCFFFSVKITVDWGPIQRFCYSLSNVSDKQWRLKAFFIRLNDNQVDGDGAGSCLPANLFFNKVAWVGDP